MSLVTDTPEHAMWPRELDLRYLDGRNWKLLADFEFVNPSARFPDLLIPAGFVTDFASIPRVLWNIIPPTDRRIAKSALIHDLFYRSPWIDITRAQADAVLRDGMQVLGASWFVRQSVYAGVRVGGGHSFKPRDTDAG